MDNTNNKILIPGAIIVAGVIIAAALFVGGKNQEGQTAGPVPTEEEQRVKQDLTNSIKEIAADDHILGNPAAEITIITYSDIDCPFCKIFHETMTQIMDEYGKTGKVRWIYRHLPLEMLHPNAKKEAEATECAYELGGTEKFWQYLEKVVSNQESWTANELNGKLSQIAKELDINKTKFEECLTSEKYAGKITAGIQKAGEANIQGTPYSLVIKGDKKAEIPGALPYEQVKQTMDSL